MKILIIGSGMYVTGRDGTGTGTILSSLADSSKNIAIEEVVVVSKNESSSKGVVEASQRINKLLGTELKVTFKTLADFDAYKNFDACIIAVPDHLHFTYGKLCLEAGLHTLMVKPLTPTVAEAKELISIAD